MDQSIDGLVAATKGRRLSFLPPPRQGGKREASGFVFPGPDDRLTINGMTGSGKSIFGVWLFSESADFNKKPWIFLDYKNETLITEALDRRLFAPLSISARIPDKPGIFVVRPNVREGQGPVSDFLWRVYERGKVGMFLDEATMVPELRGEANSGGPFQSLLSQGRSKEIPVWVLAQRPVHVNKMVYTENNFYCAFRLRSKEDLKKVVENIPDDSRGFTSTWSPNIRLPEYWSRWYDAKQDRSFLVRACPPPRDILNIISSRVESAKKRSSV